MTDIKTRVQGLDANLAARDVASIAETTGNIYEALCIIGKRANQLSVDLKSELHQKLEEFAVSSESIEEIHENKEQIEISKFYERLPNPALIATEEYMSEEINHRYKDQEQFNRED